MSILVGGFDRLFDKTCCRQVVSYINACATSLLTSAYARHPDFIGQSGHFGFFGVQTVAPRSIKAWLDIAESARDI